MTRPDPAEAKLRQLAEHPRFRGRQAEGVETSGGGGDSTGMDAVDAKIAAAEARSETALVRAMGGIQAEMAKMRAEFAKINARLDAIPARWEVLAFMVAASLAIVAALLGALSFGNDLFARGFSASDIARSAASQALAQYQATPHK